MKRISNYRNEIFIVFILIIFLFGLFVVVKESTNYGMLPVYAYLISILFYSVFIWFLIFSTKTIFLNDTKNEIIVRNTFSKKNKIIIKKNNILKVSFSKLFPNKMKIKTIDGKSYFTFVTMGGKRMFENWYGITN